MLAVHPSARRSGLGRELLDAWEADVRTRGALKVWLDVRPSNEAALRLYQGAGYRSTGKRSRYYHDGEDALLLERTL
jgi:ribosomal protein S18 acetylase RimI-like enzyme